jgi:imidazolonepropionase-like amidohydrolase
MIGQAPPEGKPLPEAAAGHFDRAHHVKVVQSGLNSIDQFGKQSEPQFDAATLKQLVRRAHARQLPVMVHANGEIPVRLAIEAGCDSIEHGYFMGKENIARMADHRITWVPTAVPMDALTNLAQLTRAQRDVACRTLNQQLEQIFLAHDSGVRMALGTDAGSIGVQHGLAVHRELRLYREAGLTIEAAVRCATLDNARLIGFRDRGVLDAGFRADLVVVPGPPDQLIEGLAGIETVCIVGNWKKLFLSCSNTTSNSTGVVSLTHGAHHTKR